MIVDSHCHAWRYWPYEPPVPDPFSRPAVEQLLFEMDQCGVQEAVLVAARIDHNPDNNDYVAYCARRFPDRRYQLPTSTACRRPHITPPGAAEHLAEAVRTPRVHSSCELSTSTSGPTDCTGAPIIRSYAGQ